MDRDKIIGILLLGLVVFLFFSQSRKKAEAPTVAPNTAAVAAAGTSVAALVATPAPDVVFKESSETVLSNALVTYVFNDTLGDIVKITLNPSEVIKTPFETISATFADYELPGRLLSFGDLSGNTLAFGKMETLDGSLSFTGSWNKIFITKTYTLVKDSYLVKLRYNFKNQGEKTLPASEARLWLGTIDKLNEAKERPPFRTLTIAYQKDNSGTKIKRYNAGKENRLFEESVFWAAIANRYFVHVLSPVNSANKIEITARPDKKLSWLSGALSFSAPSLDPQADWNFEATLYAGPKQYEILEGLDAAIGHGEKYHKIIDLGWYSIIATWMLKYGLKLTYSYVGSYGISIIILTVVIKLLLWPLTTKSTLAMKKMQKIQPEIKALQEKYKDDPKKQQEEMMLLYRKYGYNPMGGCLPMLLQLPIFVALYQALSNAIELHGTSFLWIKDLSLPDQVCTIFNFPIHPLAIAMGVGMVVQQLMTPKMGDASQQKMMYIMPIVFTALFYNMPSGLVLYWFVNQLLTMAQTTYLQYKKD